MSTSGSKRARSLEGASLTTLNWSPNLILIEIAIKVSDFNVGPWSLYSPIGDGVPSMTNQGLPILTWSTSSVRESVR